MNKVLTYTARMVRNFDRTSAKYGSSKIETLLSRAEALDIVPEARHAVYPLAWLVETGRLSTEQIDALLGVTARDFAAAALRIAASEASVNACAAAWKAVTHVTARV